MITIQVEYSKDLYLASPKTIIQIIQDDQTSQILGTTSLVDDQNILSKEIELLKSDVLRNIANLLFYTDNKIKKDAIDRVKTSVLHNI